MGATAQFNCMSEKVEGDDLATPGLPQLHVPQLVGYNENDVDQLPAFLWDHDGPMHG